MSLKGMLPFLAMAGVGFYVYKMQDDEAKKLEAEEKKFLINNPGFKPSEMLKEYAGEK